MNRQITTKELVLSGLLLASGIILPMIFHMVSLTGPIALPMHIPVLIGGFLLSPQIALALGVLTPVLSGLLTGMPVMFPMAVIGVKMKPIMFVKGAVLTGLPGIIIQLIFIPALIYGIKSYMKITATKA